MRTLSLGIDPKTYNKIDMRPTIDIGRKVMPFTAQQVMQWYQSPCLSACCQRVFVGGEAGTGHGMDAFMYTRAHVATPAGAVRSAYDMANGYARNGFSEHKSPWAAIQVADVEITTHGIHSDHVDAATAAGISQMCYAASKQFAKLMIGAACNLSYTADGMTENFFSGSTAAREVTGSALSASSKLYEFSEQLDLAWAKQDAAGLPRSRRLLASPRVIKALRRMAEGAGLNGYLRPVIEAPLDMAPAPFRGFPDSDSIAIESNAVQMAGDACSDAWCPLRFYLADGVAIHEDRLGVLNDAENAAQICLLPQLGVFGCASRAQSAGGIVADAFGLERVPGNNDSFVLKCRGEAAPAMLDDCIYHSILIKGVA